MKKILKPLTLILIVSLKLAGTVLSNPAIIARDKADQVLFIVNATPVYDDSKKTQIGVLEIDFPKVADTFSKMYCSAQSALWSKSGKSLLVSFQHGANKVRALFTVKGDLVYAITDLNVSAMPDKIGQAVQQAYPSYIVENLRLIKTAELTVYWVILENDKGIIVLQAGEEELIEIKRMKKVPIPAQKNS